MGFCFPGTARGADLPPRPECAPAWRVPLLEQLGEVRLTVMLGRYALDWHARHDARARGLAAPPRGIKVSELVAAWRVGLPDRLPLPHPSPRNRLWFRRHPWFEAELIPVLRERVRAALDA